MAEAEVIKDSPDSPEPPNKKPLVETDETPHMEKSKGEDNLGSGLGSLAKHMFLGSVTSHCICEKELLTPGCLQMLFTSLEVKMFLTFKKKIVAVYFYQ